MDNAFQYLHSYKFCTDKQYPYTGRDGSCTQPSCSDGKILTGYINVAANNPAELLSALQQRPISVAVDASNWNQYRDGVFNNCGSRLNHGVLLVGYEGNAWIIKNSWGKSWGEQGFIRLAFGNTCGVTSAASYPTF